MLVCAIMIKRSYQNSVLYNLKVTNIMKFFGVSHKKARKLIEAFKESELFIYNPVKNCVFAKSFKSKTEKFYGHRKKYVAFADYCRKMQLEDNIKLREVVRELRNILAICEINAVERAKDNLIVEGKNNKYHVTKPERMMAIPQAKLGYTMGVSRSSASRYIKRLGNEGRVGKSGIVAECIIPCLNTDTEREYRENHPDQKFIVWHDPLMGNYSGWVIYGNTYHLLTRNDSELFKHVIHNYRRGTSVVQSTSSELDGDGFWRHFCRY